MKKRQKRARAQQRPREKTQKQRERAAAEKQALYEMLVLRNLRWQERRDLIAATERRLINGSEEPWPQKR